MNIVILGKGNMGTQLAHLVQTAGHSVESFDSKGDPLAALRQADLVIIATKYEQALALSDDVGAELKGKIVVDITNPLTPDYMALTVGHTTSAAEEIAKLLSGAKVVKAFNTLFASLLQARVEGEKVGVPVFVAGDDEAAVQTVVELVKSVGLTAIPAGALSNARYLEPMAELMIQFGYGLGHGDRIGFKLSDERLAAL